MRSQFNLGAHYFITMKKISIIAMTVIGLLLMADTIILLNITASRTLGIFMPFIIGLPIFMVGILYSIIEKFLRENLFGKIIKWTMIAAYAGFTALFITTTIVCMVHGFAEPKGGADVLIVLGCGVKGERVTLTLSNRLDKAIEYLEGNENTKVVVSGGKGEGENITEACAMKKYLIEHGVDSSRIIEEGKSRSTEENFVFSKEIIDELYPKGAKIAYVTTNFHVYRAGKVAEKCGVSAEGIGASGVWYITLNDYMRECAAITVYALTGRV